jgi:WD repeat-containing protein 26
MIPEQRLAHLLNQVKQTQINNCLHHNTAIPPSLYSDHMCDRDNFPLRTMLELDSHSDEVWYLEFSHDGTKLATASKDQTVMIYETGTFTILHRLTDHEKEVTYITWSPDDSKLISCSMDHKARVWDVAVRQLSTAISSSVIAYSSLRLAAVSWRYITTIHPYQLLRGHQMAFPL